MCDEQFESEYQRFLFVSSLLLPSQLLQKIFSICLMFPSMSLHHLPSQNCLDQHVDGL